MPSIARSALLPYSQESVYALINDIERYPEFLPWCSHAAVQNHGTGEMVASITVAAKGLTERVTTRNRLTPPSLVEMDLVDGALRDFRGIWRVTALGDAGCKVELDVRFEFSGRLRLLALPFKRRLGRIADNVMDAFCQRASQVCDAH